MLYTIGEGGPVCSIVIGIGALRRGDVGTVESVLDEQGEVVRREFLLPGGLPRYISWRDQGRRRRYLGRWIVC